MRQYRLGKLVCHIRSKSFEFWKPDQTVAQKRHRDGKAKKQFNKALLIHGASYWTEAKISVSTDLAVRFRERMLILTHVTTD